MAYTEKDLAKLEIDIDKMQKGLKDKLLRINPRVISKYLEKSHTYLYDVAIGVKIISVKMSVKMLKKIFEWEKKNAGV